MKRTSCAPSPEKEAALRGPVIAVPSCLIPGTAAENVRFLAAEALDRVQEVALCFFETQGCLAYTENDLPAAPNPFRFHVHLPADLPWHIGPEGAANCCLRLMRKIETMYPRAAVLHVPEGPDAAGRLMAFAALWHERCAVPLLLENTNVSSLVALANLIADAEFGVCLDMAHMAAYGQTELMEHADLLARVRLVHWSAPAGADRHQALTRLTEAERRMMRATAARLPAGVTHLIEVFNWAGVEESLTVLPGLITSEGAS